VPEFYCSFSRDRPILSESELAIPADSMLAGITYKPRESSNPELVRKFKGKQDFQIIDTQPSITGSVNSSEFSPTQECIDAVKAHKDFSQNLIGVLREHCGDDFESLLQRVALREILEETGFFGNPEDLELVRSQRNWAIFKINITRLRPIPPEDEEKYRDFHPVKETPCIDFKFPLKVQVYIYGKREQFYELTQHIRVRPCVEADIAGIMLFEARDIEKFKSEESEHPRKRHR
jgi:8-oxo-dGTP pyrophosphatase MutT (NUDIX family)